MKLRVIFILLSFLALASVSSGGYLHYQSLRKNALKEAERQGLSHTETIKNHFSCFLTENLKSVKALAARLSRGASGPSPLDSLSNREIQVLRCLDLGQTNREIAETYGLSIKTVDTYRSRLLATLNLRNNAELSRFAIQNRLVEP